MPASKFCEAISFSILSDSFYLGRLDVSAGFKYDALLYSKLDGASEIMEKFAI